MVQSDMPFFIFFGLVPLRVQNRSEKHLGLLFSPLFVGSKPPNHLETKVLKHIEAFLFSCYHGVA